MNKGFLFSSILTLGIFATVSAQLQSADDVIARAETAFKAVKDYRANVTGTVESSDRKIQLDVNVQAIPSQELLRIEFNAPDELADNVVIIDKDTVSNYLFLTNQVTITALNRASIAGFDFNFTGLNSLSSTLPKNQVTFRPLTSENTPSGRTYILDATAKPNTNLGFSRAKVWVLENSWRPYRFQTFDAKGTLVADLTVKKWESNIGLVARTLRALPKDAEIIRKR